MYFILQTTDPFAIWAHLTPVLKFLVAKFSQVTCINFLSDGPTTQYRNRFNLYFLSHLPDFGPFTSATWNFSESGHGKGAADGIGGSLKRLADRLVAEGHDIPDPRSLYESLKGKTVTELFYITSHDIAATEALLTGVSVKRIPSTMRLHQVVFSELDHIETQHLSCFSCPPGTRCSHHIISEDICTSESCILLSLTFSQLFAINK